MPVFGGTPFYGHQRRWPWLVLFRGWLARLRAGIPMATINSDGRMVHHARRDHQCLRACRNVVETCSKANSYFGMVDGHTRHFHLSDAGTGSSGIPIASALMDFVWERPASGNKGSHKTYVEQVRGHSRWYSLLPFPALNAGRPRLHPHWGSPAAGPRGPTDRTGG